AVESVRSRDHELSVMQGERLCPGIAIVDPHFCYHFNVPGSESLQQLLGLTTQLIEVWVNGERSGGTSDTGHDELLPGQLRSTGVPVCPLGGQKSSSQAMKVDVSGGRSPSRGLGGALMRNLTICRGGDPCKRIVVTSVVESRTKETSTDE